jgi:hypothetical protein
MHMFNIFEEIRKQTAIMIDSEGNVHTHEEALRDRLERFRRYRWGEKHGIYVFDSEYHQYHQYLCSMQKSSSDCEQLHPFIVQCAWWNALSDRRFAANGRSTNLRIGVRLTGSQNDPWPSAAALVICIVEICDDDIHCEYHKVCTVILPCAGRTSSVVFCSTTL